MLIKCKECQLPVSDKASSCPHCGYPISNSTPYMRKSNRRRRLPNGFGRITEIKSKKLRRRFRVMITCGKDENGQPMGCLLKPEAYFETYNEAYEALMEYNKSPYDLDDSITVKELYDRWSTEHLKKLSSKSSERTIKSAWAYCFSIYNMYAAQVRARHIKACIDGGYIIDSKGKKKYASDVMKGKIKSLLNMMFDYALEYELVDRNYSRTFNISTNKANVAENKHIAFTEEEIQIIKDNINKVPYTDILYIQCYMGWRPQELGLIELENVHLTKGYIIGGMKTEAGTERIVPIHPTIASLIERKYFDAKKINSKYLFNCVESTNGLKLTYDKYRHRFKNIIKTLDLKKEHKAHDGRVHFVTMAKKYGVDEYAIKYIVGHAINDITEKIYTERDAKWLKEEIEKIR